MGVDVFPKGWVGVRWDGPGSTPSVLHAADFEALIAAVDAAGGPTTIGVDIPIGLPETGQRRSDLAVRALLGPRRASLFMTPVRAAVYDDDWESASRAQRQLGGTGMSKQAHALRRSIRQVRAWAAGSGRPVHEVHPETSFAFLASSGALPPRPMRASKQTWTGSMERRALLIGAGLVLPDDIGPTGLAVPPIDILDAAAAAWSAWRIASGTGLCWPAEPLPGEPQIWA